MHRLAKLVLSGVALALWAPFSLAAAVTYGALLNGPSENPVNASPGTGSTIVTLDTVTHQLHVTVVFTGLTAGTTASHIHCCVAPNGTAGVATTTPTFAGFPLGVTAGTYDAILDTSQASSWNPAFITANGGTPLSAEGVLAAGLTAGQAYLNVHSTAFPGGEIRGFLVLSPLLPSNVPTLSPWMLILAGILVASLALVVHRRRHPGR